MKESARSSMKITPAVAVAAGFILAVVVGYVVFDAPQALAAVTNNGRGFYLDNTNRGVLKFYQVTAGFNFSATTSTGISSDATRSAFSVAKHSPVNDEIIVGTLTVGGRLDIWRATSSSDGVADFKREWNATSSGALDGANKSFMNCNSATELNCTRAFDISYEQLSGRVMVVYGTTSATGARVYYCIGGGGAAWSPVATCAPTEGQNSITLSSAGRPTFISTKALPGTNKILMGVSLDVGGTHEVEACIWDGTSWGNCVVATNNTNASTGGLEHGNIFEVEWESQSQDAFVIWARAPSAGTQEIMYKEFVGGAWTAEQNGFNTYTDAAAVQTMNADRDGNTDRMVVAVNDDQGDLSVGVWEADGSTPGWTDYSSNIGENSLEGTGADVGLYYTDVAWQSTSSTTSSMAVVTALNAGNTPDIEYSNIVCNSSGCTASAIASTNTAGNDDGEAMRVVSSPNSTDIFANWSDIDRGLYAQRWSGTAWQGSAQSIIGGAVTTDDIGPGTADSTVWQGLPESFVYLPYKPWSMNWRWFDGNDSQNTPTTSLAAENTTTSGIATIGAKVRLRFQVAGRTAMAQRDARKVLQYTTQDPESSSSTWTLVGDPNGSGLFRYVDCDSGSVDICNDGRVMSTATLSGTTATGWWVLDKDAAASTTMDHATLSVLELEFPIETNGLAHNATYSFRMLDLDHNSAVPRLQSSTPSTPCVGSTKCSYPTLVSAPPDVLTQDDFQWFANTNGQTPTSSPLAAENATTTDVASGSVVHLRMNVKVTQTALPAGETFKLQYSTAPDGSWTDVGASTSAVIWRGYDNNASTDGATLDTLKLSSSTVKATYEEDNPSAGTPQAVPVNGWGEWAWVLQNNGAPGETYYYFRMVHEDGIAFESYTTSSYPVLRTATSNLTQIHYRWREDNGNGNGSWATTTVDNFSNTGQYASLKAIDENTIFIVYQESTNFDLMFAKSINGGTTWSTSTIDATGVTGYYTSIAATDANNIFVSYNCNSSCVNDDGSASELRFAKSINGGADWTTTEIDVTGIVGTYNSIAATDANNLFVSYYSASGGDLKFASSSNGGATWATKIADSSAPDVGYYSAIKAVDSNNLFITYENIGTNDLRLATSSNSGTTWTVSTIVSNMSVSYNSIAATDANNLFASYYCHSSCPGDDGTVGALRFMRSSNGGGAWSSTTIDAVGDTGSYNSIDVVGENNIFVSYQCVSSCVDDDANNGKLIFARSFDGGITWSTTSLDNIGATGLYSSVGNASSSDNLFVSYHCSTNCANDDGTAGKLLFAKFTPGASFAASQDTPTTSIQKETNIRLRFEISNEGNSATTGTVYLLEYADAATSSWTALPYFNTASSQHWEMADSSYLTNGENTININIGTSSALVDFNPTFVAGKFHDLSPTTSPISLTDSQFTELEFSIRATTNATDSGTYYFRLTNQGNTNSFSYTVYPAVILAGPGTPNVKQLRYRWRNDDGNEANATFFESENATSSSLVQRRLVRLRMGLANKGSASASGIQFVLQYGLSPGSCANVSNWATLRNTVVGAGGGDAFSLANTSNVAHGSIASNVSAGGGIADDNPTFNGGYFISLSNLTNATTITTSQFLEYEYGLWAEEIAQEGSTYCFRVTNNGDTTNFTYTKYPALTIISAALKPKHGGVLPSEGSSAGGQGQGASGGQGQSGGGPGEGGGGGGDAGGGQGQGGGGGAP